MTDEAAKQRDSSTLPIWSIVSVLLTKLTVRLSECPNRRIGGVNLGMSSSERQIHYLARERNAARR